MARVLERVNLVAILLAASVTGACSRGAAEGTPAPAASASATAPAATPSSYFGAGEQPGYAVELKSDLTVAGDAPANADNNVKLQLIGKLHLFVRSSTAGNAELGGVLFDADLAGTSSGQMDLEQLTRDIQTPFLFTLEAGRLGDVRVQAGLSTYAVSILRTLAAALQFPVAPAGGKWSVEESDATGPYVAEYEALQQAGQYAKRKLRYGAIAEVKQHSLGVAPPALGAVTPTVSESKGEVRVTDHRLSSMSYAESVEVAMLGAVPAKSNSQWDLSAAELPPLAAEPDWKQLDARLIRITAGKPYSNPTESANFDQARIGKLTFEAVVLELEKAERERKPSPGASLAKDTPREAQLFSVLGAMFRRGGRDIALAVQRIQKGSNISPRLIDALTSSGGAESQPALLQVASDHQVKLELRQAVVRSMVRLRAASPATVDKLSGFLGDPDLRINASYALGAMARRLRESGDGERSRQITTRLLQQLAESKDNALRMATLRGLANDGDNEALDAIRPLVSGEDVSMRMVAAQTLAAMTSNAAESLLVERLEKEERTSVRSAVLDACQARRPTPPVIAAVQKIALSAPDAHGRIEAARALGRWMSVRPELRATLERMAKEDKEEKVRQVVEGLLGA